MYTQDGQAGRGALQFIRVERNAPLLEHPDVLKAVSKLHWPIKELGGPSVWKSSKQ